uniref:protein TsetseEP n=1 Tax=Erigeron canadensis TaxID=72917 RepID=UPI001CB97A66|nr:protein TsetseEP [Erigeron canadensis]XP_043609061.1 protein TsetseEP [Erigeron canadensis]XP_043609062.1 protein TsetseEP [Erigeron canadensis]
MAYFDDGYIWSQDQNNQHLVAYQDSVSFSGYETYGLENYNAYNVSEFHEPKYIGLDHGSNDYDYGNDYGHNLYLTTNSEIDYFAHTIMEPKLVMYQPVECNMGYISYHTNYSISNSEMDSGFNEPEFEDYDPTPYDGGYDIVSVYGKPLPPSDKTCYPRSKPKPIEQGNGPKPKPGPDPHPMVEQAKLEPEKEQKPKSRPETMHVPVLIPEPVHTPMPVVQPDPEPKPKPEPEPEPEQVLVPLPEPLEVRDNVENEKEEYGYPGYRYDYPWPEYGNGIGVGYDYGYGRRVVQIPPYEYDPEVVDLCESLFGSWPCLARMRNQQQMSISNNPRTTCPETRHYNPWEVCASYIFGGQNASYHQ